VLFSSAIVVKSLNTSGLLYILPAGDKSRGGDAVQNRWMFESGKPAADWLNRHMYGSCLIGKALLVTTYFVSESKINNHLSYRWTDVESFKVVQCLSAGLLVAGKRSSKLTL
jgi:hypothetical protein